MFLFFSSSVTPSHNNLEDYYDYDDDDDDEDEDSYPAKKEE